MKTLSDFTKGCYTRAWKHCKAVLVQEEHQRCAAMMAAHRMGKTVTSEKLNGSGFIVRLVSS